LIQGVSFPENIPDYLARPDLARLAIMVRHAKRGAFLIALYNTVAARDGVVETLRRLAAPMKVFEYTLGQNLRNPIGYLDRIPPTAHKEQAVVFIFDTERAISANGDGETVWQFLETGRETLSSYPHALVFWLTEKGAQDAARNAPNFWSRKSGVFDFTIEAKPVITQLRSEWIAAPVQIDQADDIEKLYRLYAGLLDEFRRDDEANPAILAALHGKLGYLAMRNYQPDEAMEHLGRQRVMAISLEDPKTEADALLQIGQVHAFRDDRDAALASYEQALKNFRAIGSQLGEANVLMAIGDVQQFRDDRDAALASYEQALKNFRAIGDRLGEANVLMAIGDVQQFRDDRDAALASYEQALKNFRAIGDRLGEANVLKAIGDVQQFRKELDAALASYEQALKNFRAIGDRLGEANVLASQGRLYLIEGDVPKAERLLNQAIGIYQMIGDRYSVPANIGNYGWALLRDEKYTQAEPYLRKAAQLFREMGLSDYAERHQQAADYAANLPA